MSNFIKEQFENLVYAETAKEEQQTDMNNIMFLINDEEMVSAIKGYHDKNMKCAAVCIIENEDLPDGFIAGYDTIVDFFNFKQVKQALDSYDPETEICYLFVRDNKITANVVGTGKTEKGNTIH